MSSMGYGIPTPGIDPTTETGVPTGTSGLATEPKQDDIIAVLGALGTEATLADIQAALAALGTEATLLDILAAIQSDALTNTELRATPVSVTDTNPPQTDGLTDTELRASDIEVNDNAAQALLTSMVGALGDTITADTVRELLLRIYGAVDGLELSVGDIDVNTDGIEAALATLNAVDFATQTTLEAARVLLDSINTALAGQQTDGLTDAQLRAADVAVTLAGEQVGVSNFPASQTVDDGGGSITVDGTVTVTGTQVDALTDVELRATPVPVSGTVAVSNQPTTQIDALTDTELRAAPVVVDTGLTQGVQDGGTVTVDQGAAGATAWPVDITGATVEIANQAQLVVDEVLNATAYDLNAAAYSYGVALANDSLLGALNLRFTTAESKTITVTHDDGTEIIPPIVDDTSLTIDVDFERLPIDGGSTITVAVTTTAGACLMDATMTVEAGASQIGGSAHIAGEAPDGAFVNVPLGGEDPDNSTTTALTAAEVYTGTWRRNSGYESMLAFAYSDVSLTVEIEWSLDGINVMSSALATTTVPESETGGFFLYLDVLTTLVAPYHRLVVTCGATGTSTFEAYTWLYGSGFPGSFGGLSAALSSLSSALLTRSVIAGIKPDGTFGNAGLTYDGSQHVSQQEVGERLAFRSPMADRALTGQAAVTSRIDDVSIDFSRAASLNAIDDTASANGGTVTLVDALMVVSSGVAANGVGSAVTVDNITYRAANEISAEFTAIFTTPTATSTQYIGPFDGSDGFMLGYQGLDFGLRHMRNGVEESFTAIGLNPNLFRRDDVPERLDPLLNNLYRLRWEHLGTAPLLVEVMSPDGEYVLIANLKFPNSRLDTTLLNPSLPVTSIVAKTAGAEDITISTGSIRAGTTGDASGLRPSQFPNRTHFQDALVAVTTASTTLYTVPAGTRVYVTSISVTATNSTNTTGIMAVRDGASTYKVPLIVPGKQGSGPDGFAAVSFTFPEPLEFNTDVRLTITAGSVTASLSIQGYEEIV